MGIGFVPTMPTPRVKGCTGHSERPRLCGPRANYRDNYSCAITRCHFAQHPKSSYSSTARRALVPV